MKRIIRLNTYLAISVFLFGIGHTIALGGAIYVDTDAPGPAHDGSSWTTAFNYLQDALAAAQDGNDIHVAQGTYLPDANSAAPNGTGERTATFELKNGVGIYGGYAGYGEPDPNARDIATYSTILSGDLGGNDGPNFANNGENSYHVVFGQTGAILDGFTINGGNANGGDSDDYGGGMYNTKNPTVSNCTFTSNFAVDRGGGIYNSGSPTLTNCTLLGNYSYEGGGMWETGNATLTNCTFSENVAGEGGGMYIFYYTGPDLIGCMFSGNVANFSGGAMYNYYNANPMVVNCTFRRNSAGKGGVVYNTYKVYPTFVNCLFVANTANYEGGVIYNSWEVEVVNCTFTGNLAASGRAVASKYEGHNPQVQIMNCIMWDGGSEIWNYNELSEIIVSYSDVEGSYPGEGNIDADPCFVDANGPDNILGTDDDNLRLRGSSPCIDAADNNSVPFDSLDLDGDHNTVERIPVDFDWAVRFVDEPSVPDTGNGTPPIVDMGIYEYGTGVCGDEHHPYPKGDLNYDCHVDFQDFATFSAHWLKCTAPECE